jgi:hypothetical protein
VVEMFGEKVLDLIKQSSGKEETPNEFTFHPREFVKGGGMQQGVEGGRNGGESLITY